MGWGHVYMWVYNAVYTRLQCPAVVVEIHTHTSRSFKVATIMTEQRWSTSPQSYQNMTVNNVVC